MLLWSPQLPRLPGWGEQSQCSGSWREDEERPQSKECSHHGLCFQSYFRVCLLIGSHPAASNTLVVFDDNIAVSPQVDEELEALSENGEGLYDEKQVVALCRLMVRVETMEQKLICFKLIQV